MEGEWGLKEIERVRTQWEEELIRLYVMFTIYTKDS
jgi:hypothetical protein